MDFTTKNKFTNYFLDTSIDISREAYKNKNNEFNNKPVDRFESNIFLNSKESFDFNNKKINDLQNEISTLKKELKTIYEKEEEIYKLKLEKDKLKKDISKNNLLETENRILKNENINLKIELKGIQSLRDERE